MRLLLASASPARSATLRSAGIDPLIRVSGVDEDAALARAEADGPVPHDRVPLILARAKAEAVAAGLGQDWPGDDADRVTPLVVVGCDSVLELDGRILGKPHTPAIARQRIREMRNTSGTLHTGHWLIHADAPTTATWPATGAVSSTVVHFADMTDDEIDAYVATGEPLEVAGSFTIDGLGGPFVTGIEGDHHGVVGISLPLLRTLLDELGLRITDLWDRR